MKTLITIFLVTAMLYFSYAKDLEKIKLEQPNLQRGTNVMQALKQRASVRQFSKKLLNLQDLSDLLWAANGINREKEGKRTAPSAMNVQDIDIYVCLEEGIYIYNALNNELIPIVAGDYRSLAAGRQAEMAIAPAFLIMVSDFSKFTSGSDEQKNTLAAIDAGVISENISIFCASAGLGTVPRITMDKQDLRTVMKLKESQKLIMNNPVGYPEK